MKLLEDISAAIEIMAYMVFSFGPLICGIYFLIEYADGWFEKPYQESMFLGIGIISVIVGIAVLFASFIGYRDIISSSRNKN